jgi:N-acetylglutamate synthase-like GNAT family acetyltransferase
VQSAKYVIRKASPGDSPGILECLRCAFEPFRAEYTVEAFEDTILTPASLVARFSSTQIYVAIAADRRKVAEAADGLIVGTIACSFSNAKEGHLRGMAVAPAWQGSGIANSLLRVAETSLAEQGCVRVTLDTTQALSRAKRFYERNGYRQSGTVTDFFGMPLYEYAKELAPIRTRQVDSPVF